MKGLRGGGDISSLIIDSKIDWQSNSRLGAKNLIKYPYLKTTSVINGITFTDNGDGTITANGTNTSTTQIGYAITSRLTRELILPNGKYILSGCPENGSSSTYYLQSGRTYNGTFGGLGDDYGSSVEITLNGDDYDTNTVGFQIVIIIRPGVTVSNLLFKPMLRIATDTDDTWHPYSDTNENLTANKVDWRTEGILGAKNRLYYPYYETTLTRNGITFTDLGDGRIQISGTATEDAGFICSNYTTSNSYNTMLMTGGLNSNCWMRARVINSDGTFNSSFDDYGDGAIIGPIPGGCKIGILIYIRSGFVANNEIIYPMIRYAFDSDPTYRPYARTNRELTVDGFYGGKTYYGTCATAAATAAKVSTITGFKLMAGTIVVMRFTYDVPASSTLNISSTGAKTIYAMYNSNTRTLKAGTIRAYDFATFVYDGTYYQLISTTRGDSTVWTPSVSAAVGDTTVTISHAAILANNTDQVIEVFSFNTSQTVIGIESVVTTAGQAVITFSDALEEATDFRLKITYI